MEALAARVQINGGMKLWNSDEISALNICLNSYPSAAADTPVHLISSLKVPTYSSHNSSNVPTHMIR